TPAVGGVPRDNALAWMAGNGEQRHGWYTGGFGWVDRDGDGEISVVLRCALLQGNCAEVSAGAGIVADSDPTSELEETDLKLRAMLEALEEA
ncbi:MAG: chorismate-binding protein, partial [Rhodospirillales bacterium]|nr:chorismate-binding protein [Rhodospirillales bacterium]